MKLHLGEIVLYHKFNHGNSENPTEAAPAMVTRENPDGSYNVCAFGKNSLHFNRCEIADYPSAGKITRIPINISYDDELE